MKTIVSFDNFPDDCAAHLRPAGTPGRVRRDYLTLMKGEPPLKKPPETFVPSTRVRLEKRLA